MDFEFNSQVAYIMRECMNGRWSELVVRVGSGFRYLAESPGPDEYPYGFPDHSTSPPHNEDDILEQFYT